MREGSYSLPDGRKVRYTDSHTIQEVLDLYQFIDHDYKGSDSIDAKRLEDMISRLQTGVALGTDDWNVLDSIRTKVGPGFEKWQKSGRDGQDAAIPEGPGRIQESKAGTGASGTAPIEAQSGNYDGTPSTTNLDRQISTAHLTDSVLHDLAHTRQHILRILQPDVQKDDQSTQFNAEHALHHAESAQDHAKKLDRHLGEDPSNPKVHKAERDYMQQAREDVGLILGTGDLSLIGGQIRKVIEDSPFPPPNLREADPGSSERCGTCRMNNHGNCMGYNNLSIQPSWVCNAWDRSNNLLLSEAARQSVVKLKRDSISNVNATTVAEPAIHEPTLAVDFDGVLHQGPHGLPGHVNGTLIDGAKEGLQKIKDMGYGITVFTARVDLEAVRDWLKKMGLGGLVDEVTNHKPPASAYIDDRATHFTDWKNALQAVDPLVPVSEHPQVGNE